MKKATNREEEREQPSGKGWRPHRASVSDGPEREGGGEGVELVQQRRAGGGSRSPMSDSKPSANTATSATPADRRCAAGCRPRRQRRRGRLPVRACLGRPAPAPAPAPLSLRAAPRAGSGSRGRASGDGAKQEERRRGGATEAGGEGEGKGRQRPGAREGGGRECGRGRERAAGSEGGEREG